MPISSTRPPHQWLARANDLRKLARATEPGPVRTAMDVVEVEYKRLAANSPRWQVGARVSRKDSDELGTVIETDDRAKIKVTWDGGRTSYFLRDKPANVKLLDPQT